LSPWKLLLSVLLAFGLGLWIFAPIIFQPPSQVGQALLGEEVPEGEIFSGPEKKVEVAQLVQGPKNIFSFWAEWCAPCVNELPRIQQSSESLKNAGINLVLINVDQGIPAKIFGNIQAWMVSKKLSFKTFYDFNSDYLDQLDLPSLPVHLGVSQERKVLWVEEGEIEWDLAGIEKRLN
jgi:thiol-disulfide isomerase/thioredoxin